MKNITIEEYAGLEDTSQYFFLKDMLPSDMFGCYQMNVSQMSYEKVKGVMRTLSKFSNWEDAKDIFETCFDIDAETFWNGKITDFFAAKNYIVITFKNLLEREKKLLSSISKDSALWEAAGGNKMNRFSEILPLTQLGKIYGIYPFELKDMKYHEIIMLLSKETVESSVMERFYELKYK